MKWLERSKMNPQVPTYISLAFLVAICIPVYLMARLAKKYSDSKYSGFLFYAVICFYLVYLSVVAFASLNGFFTEITLPPKIIQLTTFPLLLFLMGVIFNAGVYKSFLKAIPVEKLILLHQFRLIGSFFIILLLFQLLPVVFAMLAGLGDIITALSSIWIAKMVKIKKKHAHRLVILWNSFGLLDIFITSISAVIITKMSIETGELGVDILATFPFCFIPAFAPATIIFLHMSIYRKVFVKKYG